MQAITNSNSERIADAASTAGAPSQPTDNSCAQSSFDDCLEREQQSQAAASQPSQQGVVNLVNTSAIPQNASVIDYSLAPQGAQIGIQSSVQMAAMDLNSTLINLGIAKWAPPNPNPDPMPTPTQMPMPTPTPKPNRAPQPSAQPTPTTRKTGANASPIPVLEPIPAAMANLTAFVPNLQVVQVPPAVAPDTAGVTENAKSCAAAVSMDLSSIITTGDAVGSSYRSPVVCDVPVSNEPTSPNFGLSSLLTSAPVVPKASANPAILESAAPTISPASPQTGPMLPVQVPGQSASDQPAPIDTGKTLRVGPLQDLPTDALPADLLIPAKDEARDDTPAIAAQNSADARASLPHAGISAGEPPSIEISGPAVPKVDLNGARLGEASQQKTAVNHAGANDAAGIEIKAKGEAFHSISNSVQSNVQQIPTAIGHGPELQPTLQAEKFNGDSTPSVKTEPSQVHGRESAVSQKNNTNSDSNDGSAGPSNGQTSTGSPSPAVHVNVSSTGPSFSTNVDTALNSAAIKQEIISSAPSSSGIPVTSGNPPPAAGLPVTDRREAEAATAGPAWDLASPHAERLVQSAQFSQNAVQSEMRIHLSTEAMGSVELRTTVQQDRIAAAITVQRSETQSALIGELPSLHQALQDRQLQVERFDINYGGQNSEMSSRHESNSQNGGFERQQNSPRNWAFAESVRTESKAEIEMGLDSSRILSVRA